MTDETKPPVPPTPPSLSGEDARAFDRAHLALVQPFDPTMGTRCPRCGQRIDPGKETVACPACAVTPRSADAGRALVAEGSLVGELLRGALYLPRGAFRILVTPRLWKYAVIPLVIDVLLVVLAWWVIDHFVVDWLRANTGTEALTHWQGWFWGILRIVVRWMGYIAWFVGFLLVGWLIFGPLSVFTQILFAPFMELLSRETEAVVVRKDAPREPIDFAQFQADMAVAIVDVLLLWVAKLFVILVTLPIALIPVIGTLVWLLIPSFFVGMDWTDIDFVRKKYRTREKIAAWRGRFFRFLGFGAATWLVINIPILNCAVIPAAAVGGTILYLELDRK